MVHGKSILYTSENVVDYTKEAKKEWSSSSIFSTGTNTINFVFFIYDVIAWGFGFVVNLASAFINQFLGHPGRPGGLRDPQHNNFGAGLDAQVSQIGYK